MESDQVSKIVDFYKGKCVFITGATGFVGKVLVEKLLRTCSLDTIYLLIRQKKGLSAGKRLDQFFSSRVFNRLKEDTLNYRNKVKIVTGDISQPNLGISNDIINTLIKDVSLVFHLAATLHSNQNMKSALEENVFSVRRLLELCQKLTKLEAILYTSTAYCNYEGFIIEEKIYPAKVTVEFAASCLDHSDTAKLEELKNRLMKHPDTHIFTKCIAENLLLQERGNLPVAIIRPSIIINSHKEPFPGWVENFNIPATLAAGMMKGILRTQVIYQENIIDIIPVDLAVNMMLAIAWYTAMKRDNHLLIYHCTSGDENPITWGQLYNLIQRLMYEYPSGNVFRYPSISLKRSSVVNKVATYLDHYLPAAVADGFSILTGNKPKMLNLYKQLAKTLKLLEYYTTNQWKFISKNKNCILDEMTELDKKLVNFDVKTIQWKSFILTYALGTREHLMKESPCNIWKARNNLRRYLWTHRIINASFLFGLGYLSLWALTY